MMFLLLFVLPITSAIVMSPTQKSRRTLTRFTKGHPDHDICWDRHGLDGFTSVIDAHNHFRPFFGPSVSFEVYLGWMHDQGILFSTMFGIGQLIQKKNPNDPDCCYYLHCPNFNYTVVPDPTNDRANAEDYLNRYKSHPEVLDSVHLTLSLTSPNLQRPENNSMLLSTMDKDFPNTFAWAGEINVFKHALAANGFFNGPRVTVSHVESGALDSLFQPLSDRGWPVTLHCDLGCDNYDSVPLTDPRNPLRGCEVPPDELQDAMNQHGWWRDFLGPHYKAFFHVESKVPKDNFKKIQHVKVWDAILSRYPNLKVVWAHIGLSKELRDLHPVVHSHVMATLFERHPNLHADISWDILAKLLLMNYKQGSSINKYTSDSHEDFDREAASFLFNHTEVDGLRRKLHNLWLHHKDKLHATGSKDHLRGPTHAMAMYLDVLHKFSDRFVTGTDFVASNGAPQKYPGLRNPPKGCVKDEANHARQMTDTSSINMFLEDDAFSNIVLGRNYFRLTGIDQVYEPPPICGQQVECFVFLNSYFKQSFCMHYCSDSRRFL